MPTQHDALAVTLAVVLALAVALLAAVAGAGVFEPGPGAGGGPGPELRRVVRRLRDLPRRPHGSGLLDPRHRLHARPDAMREAALAEFRSLTAPSPVIPAEAGIHHHDG
jgi:hypothetical protein